MSTQMTTAQLREFIKVYVNGQKISNPVYAVTRDNTAGLLDKIARTITLDGNFEDKLSIFNGEELGLAKDLEEYYANLIMPTNYDPSGSAALAPADLTYMPAFYSKTLGRKQLKVTRRYDDLERAFTSEADYAVCVSMTSKRLQDSKGAYDFATKKQLLAEYADKAIEEMTATETGVWDGAHAYNVGKVLRKAVNSNVRGIVVKKINAGDVSAWGEGVELGYIVELDLVTSINEPTDSTTGEAFIKAVKTYVKKAKFISEGNSLNGNTLGASSEGLVLVIKAGVMPSLEVDTMAGAFHADKLGFDVEVVETDDFGGDANDIIAMLVDRRAVKVHPSYLAVREQANGEGDFINYIMHIENTLFYSRNTFMHVFKKA